jgi:hypothetical protein
VIRRRGGVIPSEFEVWIGEQQIGGVVSYQVTERHKEVPKLVITVECDELIIDGEYDFADVKFIGRKEDDGAK